ncbi:MAG: maltose alpha-D-glucosyltransferase [Geminicoccaceae bacterium]|nr:MAG: maltose alpha-D-glucosyltransferase [Geminicoccaceae bacterium]
MTDPLWYKDAIIYQTHIKAFFDANNDGIGDFEGLIQKLDYIQDLGVDTIWLLPFYPSPLRDDGYDIQDYRSVNPSYGSMGHVKRLVREAHRRGLRLITELVINHTSDQHPWFQRARRAKAGSNHRDYYVWSDTDQKYQDTRIIFLDTEKSNWSWDTEAGAYYWHRFYSHQPDLNFDNPAVMREVLSVLHYWLKLGIDGLRLDAIPYLIEREGTNCENLPETHEVLKRIRAELDAHYPDKMLLAEANQWPEDTQLYFGDGDECHMSFHFPLMPRMYLALAQEDRHPITDILRQTPEIPEICQWAVFLRNHDELTLEMVTEHERNFLWNTYASDRRMRINLGIRRRLAPLMDNDRRKIELMNSLLFSMPGTPVVYYGDEIGMGDNVYLGDRDGVRTPMQWSPDRNAGFSRANPQQLYLPAIMDPVYGYETVNVEAQARSPSSLLNWMKRLIAVRKAHQTFGRGSLEFLYPGNRAIFAYTRSYQGETILCVVNLSRRAQPVELNLQEFAGRVPVELLGRTPFPPIGELPYLLTLPGHGFYWFLLAEEAEVPSWHEHLPEPLPDFVTIVLRDGWSGAAEAWSKSLELKALRAFAENQRWFAAKDAPIRAVAVGDTAVLPDGKDGILLVKVEVDLTDGSRHVYLLPVGIAWGEENLHTGAMHLPFTLAKVRRGPRVGALYDATAGEDLAHVMLEGMRGTKRFVQPKGEGALVFEAGKQLADLPPFDDPGVKRLGVEQSNSSMMIGRDVIVKVYRRLQPGVHPEVEIGRFLTDVGGFANTPPLLGSLTWVDGEGEATVVAAAFGFVLNQGDGWAWSLGYLERELEPSVLAAATLDDVEDAARREAVIEHYGDFARRLGERTGDMHRAFAVDTDDPAFAKEPITAADVEAWSEAALRQAETAFTALERSLEQLAESDRPLAARVLAAKALVEQRLRAIASLPLSATKTRLHGDYHLGQVLVAKDDVYVLDFEGEPARSLDERRLKLSPTKDVAGMLRSFDYAAHTMARRFVADHPHAATFVHEMMDRWRDATSRAFQEGYAAAMQGVPSWPDDPDEAQRLLDLFLIEKALYEIAYEAANRPAWLAIPLQGLAAILQLDDEG